MSLAPARPAMALRVPEPLPAPIRAAGRRSGLAPLADAHDAVGQQHPAHDAGGDDGSDEDEGQDGHLLPPWRSRATNRRPGGAIPVPSPERRTRACPPLRAAGRAARASSLAALAFVGLAAEPATHVENLGADRVAAVLGVALDDLGPLLEGRVVPPPTGLRRLRKETAK